MSQRLTYGSLFSGVGGMDLGLDRAGLECKWQCEINEYASRVLAKHWPDVRRWGDVRTFPPEEGDWGVDLIAGGFPCIDISCAGKGAGIHGEHSGLWWEFARVIGVLRPKYVLIENVSALLTRGMDSVLWTLASHGYVGSWTCLQAANVGAPHLRDRIFILGHADKPRKNTFASARPPRHAVGQPGVEPAMLADAERAERRQSGAEGRELDDSPHGLQAGRKEDPSWFGVGSAEDLARFREAVGRKQWEADPADDPESGVGRMAGRSPHRLDRLRGLGNIVVPQIAEWLGRQIVEFHKRNTEPK